MVNTLDGFWVAASMELFSPFLNMYCGAYTKSFVQSLIDCIYSGGFRRLHITQKHCNIVVCVLIPYKVHTMMKWPSDILLRTWAHR
jgi:hypothetical protein